MLFNKTFHFIKLLHSKTLYFTLLWFTERLAQVKISIKALLLYIYNAKCTNNTKCIRCLCVNQTRQYWTIIWKIETRLRLILSFNHLTHLQFIGMWDLKYLCSICLKFYTCTDNLLYFDSSFFSRVLCIFYSLRNLTHLSRIFSVMIHNSQILLFLSSQWTINY